MGALLMQLATWLQGLAIWVIQQIWIVALTFLAGLIAMFTSVTGQAASAPALMADMATYANIANSWLPIDFGLTLLVAYYTAVLIPVKTVRIVKSFIPTLG